MQELIEKYNKKIKAKMKSLKNGGNCIQLTAIGTELECYRTFITELEAIDTCTKQRKEEPMRK